MSSFPIVKFSNAPIQIIDGDRGKNYPNSEELTAQGHCLFLSAVNVTKNGFDFSSGSQFISQTRDNLLRNGKLSREDIVITTRGTVGNIAYYDASIPFEHIRINSGMLILRPDPSRLLPPFLYSYLRSDLFREQLNALLTGSAQPQLPVRDLKFLKIPLPPLTEQRKIAQILSTWDEAIALVEALIAALKRRKQGLMQRLLTGEVRFPGFEGEWQEFQVSELGEISSGGTPDTTRPEYWGGEIPWVTPSEITALETKYILRTERNITNEGLGSSSARIIPPHSIILCTRATIGEAAINLVPMSTNQGIKSLTLRNDHDTEFVYYLLIHHKHLLKRLANGSTFLELSKADFANIRFLIPQPKEQAAIADLLSNLDVYIEGASTHIKHLREQKRGLMQRLLTGEVRVTSP